jgi:predicted phage terminase large subunit-like protein
VWHLGQNASDELVIATYGQALADDHSRAARQVRDFSVEAGIWDHLKARREGKDTASQWDTVGKGSVSAVGVGGPLTGRGAHVLIIDDPIKDAEEASSPTTRRRVWEWYTTTAYTRLAPGGGVLVCMTRWNEADLVGLLEDEAKAGGDAWEVVRYPAIAEEDETHRGTGEALHPERYPLSRLERIRAAVGARAWTSLYQQHPTAQAGEVFRREWFQHYTAPPAMQAQLCDEVAISVDAAFKGGRRSDFVVLQVWGRRGALRYLLDQVRARMELPATQAALKALAAKWPTAGLKLIEDKANGPALIQTLRSEVSGLVGYNPRASKEARAQTAAVAFEAGQVWLPSPSHAPWVGDFCEELAGFPHGAQDDQVDAMSQILIRWSTLSDFAVAVA